MLDKKNVNNLCENALHIIRQNNNFVHDMGHNQRVLKQALMIGKNYSVNRNLLKVACYWHDVGRNDWNIETKRHEELSIELLKKALEKFKIPIALTDRILLEEVIRSHRNRKSSVAPLSKEAKILWDADKLDSFNLNRVAHILQCYKKGLYSPAFNYLTSFTYWMSLDVNFKNKLHTLEAKRIFDLKYPHFRSHVEKEWKKFLQKSKKIMLIGGGDILDKTQDFIFEHCFFLIPKTSIRLYYLPLALFNNQEAIKTMGKYLNCLSSHLKKLDKRVSVLSASPKSSSSEIKKRIKEADIIYLSGGDTSYLISMLEKLKISPLLIKQWLKGKLLIGNSAGALAFLSKGISFSSDTIKHYQGIKMEKNFIFVVHYSNHHKNLLEKIIQDHPEMEVFPIKENEGYLIIEKQAIKLDKTSS